MIGAVNITHVSLGVNNEFVSYIRDSPLYKKELAWMQQITNADVYAVLYKRLFKLAPRLQKKLLTILDNTLTSPKHRLVCIQIRLAHDAFKSDWAHRNSVDNLPKIWKFMNKLTASQNDKVFVMG